jgi:hypothetical protein
MPHKQRVGTQRQRAASWLALWQDERQGVREAATLCALARKPRASQGLLCMCAAAKEARGEGQHADVRMRERRVGPQSAYVMQPAHCDVLLRVLPVVMLP